MHPFWGSQKNLQLHPSWDLWCSSFEIYSLLRPPTTLPLQTSNWITWSDSPKTFNCPVLMLTKTCLLLVEHLFTCRCETLSWGNGDTHTYGHEFIPCPTIILSILPIFRFWPVISIYSNHPEKLAWKLLVLIIRAHEYNLIMSVMMLRKISIKWRRHEYNNLTLNDMSYIQC